MNKRTVIIFTGILFVLIFAISIVVWRYNEKRELNNYWENYKKSCENSGGTFLGPTPSDWKDNGEINIRCRCPEGTQWSFSPNFRCE